MDNKSPFKLDKFGTRIKTYKQSVKPDNVYKRKAVTLVATLIFVFTDFTALYTLWRATLASTNMILLYLMCIAMGVLLDVPLAIAAVVVKEFEQGIASKSKMVKVVAVSIAAFLAVFLFNIPFRLATMNLLIDKRSIDEAGKTVAAWFLAFLPLATSLGAFVISYYSADPREDTIKIKRVALIRLEANIERACQILQENEEKAEYISAVKAKEDDCYQNALGETEAAATQLKTLARLLIAQKLGSPSDVSASIKSNKKLLTDTDLPTDPPTRMPEFIVGMCGDLDESTTNTSDVPDSADEAVTSNTSDEQNTEVLL